MTAYRSVESVLKYRSIWVAGRIESVCIRVGPPHESNASVFGNSLGHEGLLSYWRALSVLEMGVVAMCHFKGAVLVLVLNCMSSVVNLRLGPARAELLHTI